MRHGEGYKSNNHGVEPHMDTVRKRPAEAGGRHHDAGPEKHADVRGAQEGGDRAEGRRSGGHVGETHLNHATRELHSQHPHHHSAGGIHGTKDHMRHERHKG